MDVQSISEVTPEQLLQDALRVLDATSACLIGFMPNRGVRQLIATAGEDLFDSPWPALRVPLPGLDFLGDISDADWETKLLSDPGIGLVVVCMHPLYRTAPQHLQGQYGKFYSTMLMSFALNEELVAVICIFRPLKSGLLKPEHAERLHELLAPFIKRYSSSPLESGQLVPEWRAYALTEKGRYEANLASCEWDPAVQYVRLWTRLLPGVRPDGIEEVELLCRVDIGHTVSVLYERRYGAGRKVLMERTRPDNPEPLSSGSGSAQGLYDLLFVP